jgi:hypothetical protein
MTAVRATISKFLDESFPGWVECWFEDSQGRAWTFHEKVPVLTADDLWVDSEYPRPCAIACMILEHKSDSVGRRIAVIDTSSPWGIESTEGTTVFEVFSEQLEGGNAETDL